MTGRLAYLLEVVAPMSPGARHSSARVKVGFAMPTVTVNGADLYHEIRGAGPPMFMIMGTVISRATILMAMVSLRCLSTQWMTGA